MKSAKEFLQETDEYKVNHISIDDLDMISGLLEDYHKEKSKWRDFRTFPPDNGLTAIIRTYHIQTDWQYSIHKITESKDILNELDLFLGEAPEKVEWFLMPE